MSTLNRIFQPMLRFVCSAVWIGALSLHTLIGADAPVSATPIPVAASPVTPPGVQAAEPAPPQPLPPTPAADKSALYIEQTYNYASIEGAGQRSRDVLQRMYILPDRIAIHDSAESVIVDLKKRTVTNIHHDKKNYRTETFEQIKTRINKRIAMQRESLEKMVPGEQKNKLYETIKGFLDDEVTYASDVKQMVEKTPSGAFVDSVTIQATRTHDGKTSTETVLTARLSREIRLPFENFNYAEALYYLELASEKMTKQFTGAQALLVPLELKLTLPTGGSVESKIQKFEYQAKFEDRFFLPPSEYADEGKNEPKVPVPPKDLEQ